MLATAFVGCKNPNTDTPDEPEVPTKSTETSNDKPVEKLSDNYIYLGDMLFATTMDFNAWKFTNGTYDGFTGKVLATKLIKRVSVSLRVNYQGV